MGDYAWSMVVMPIAAYLLWAVNYATINFIVAKSTIAKNRYENCYIYFTEKPAIKSYFSKKGMKLSPVIFLIAHFMLFFVGHLMAMLCYEFYWFNTVVVIVFFNVGVWNGAVYYMEYFCRKYEKQLLELERMEHDTDQQ
jgi:hypothetical protein